MSSLKDEILDPTEAVQQAYDNSVKTNWTIARHSAALSMGANILAGVFGSELRMLQKKGSYPNVLRDVVIVLWLQSLSPDEVIRVNTGLDIDAAINRAFEWAEKEGIQYGSTKYLEGVRILTEIVGSVFASFYAVDGDKSKPFKKKYKTAWQIQLAFYPLQCGIDYYTVMNLLPLAAVIQFQAQLAIDRGVKVITNSRIATQIEDTEFRKILNG